MKENDDILTPGQVEELCRLYMDCRLSVLEETELQFILGSLPYSSSLIDETRAVMGIVSRPAPDAERTRKPLRRWPVLTGVAAAVIAVFCLAISVIDFTGSREMERQDIYIVYVNGQKVDSKQAETLALERMRQTDELIACMDRMIAQEQQNYNNFLNHTTSKQ